MYSEADSPLNLAARLICAQVSSSARKYRLGVCPVAGLPLLRGILVVVSISSVYVHPENLSIPPRKSENPIILWVDKYLSIRYNHGVESNELDEKTPGRTPILTGANNPGRLAQNAA